MPSQRSSLVAFVILGLAVFGCSRRDPYHSVVGEFTAGSVPAETTDDSRLVGLLRAAEGWRKSRGPERVVIDRVVLVDDVPGFFSALSTWDGRSFFPILIDDPRWTIPFIRAFRPAEVVRWPSTPRRYGEAPLDEWGAAGEAVSRAWIEDESGAAALPTSGMRPHGFGPTPPGLVLSHPGSPSLAGAAALAAGRFQPLVRVGKVVAEGRRDESLGFQSTLTEEQALAFARRVEARVASVTRKYGELGDEVDFLTLAGDWPYRYDVPQGGGLNQGDRAMDDLFGRDLGRGEVGEERWAFAGRLLGDAPTSVHHAMAALFLQPESALLWNTYGGGEPWSDYDVAGAAVILGLIRPGAVEARSGSQADLSAWHETSRSPIGRDLLMMSTSGAPNRFSIAGGSGTPGDVPFWSSSIVSMIHSFSAADPTDPDTIAGRFLDRGAFIYFGSMNEPFLTSFRPPYITSQLMVAELPLVAALRQGSGEGFGFPWRLVYLGDPLYHIDPNPASDRPARKAPGPPPPGAFAVAARSGPDSPDAAVTLDWCYDASLLAAATFGVAATPEVLRALDDLDRGRLDVGRRAKLDALLIDRSLAAGDVEGLLDRLLRIAPAERSPTVWRAIETAVFDRLAAHLREERFDEAMNLWARIASGPWRPETDLPGELTRRVADSLPPARVSLFRQRLVQVRDGLESSTIPADRRRMLDETLRTVDKIQVR